MAGVKSVERAISLLSEVAHEPRGLVDLAAAAELPTSTTARLLGTLEGLDALRRDNDGVYYLGSTIGGMAASQRGEPRLREYARPYLEEMAFRLNEAVALSVVMGEENVTVEQVDVPRPVQAENWEGTRWPLADGPAGYAVVSTWPKAKQQAFLQRHPERPELAQCIAQRPSSGVWWSEGHYVEGLTSAVVAVLDADAVAIALLYAYGPSYRFPSESSASMVEGVLLDATQRLSRAWQARSTPLLKEVG
ncbi:MAG: helix-turn-helix domain-containing protein [Ornithinimicrobium sp.]